MENNGIQLRFSDVVVHFNFVFDLGRPVNPLDAARRVLRTELGQAFRNYLTDKSEIADKYKPMAQGFNRATSLQAAYKQWRTRPGLVTYLRLFKQDPIRFGTTFIKAFITGFWKSTAEIPTAPKNETEHEPLKHFTELVGQRVSDLLALLAIQENVDPSVSIMGWTPTADNSV